MKIELSFRARRILYAAVTEYIATGEPVGSRKLARRYGLDVSPATIRNELADLEEMGYLAQPHTSAGRVPTDKGFRAFVDALVRVREVQPSDRAALLEKLTALNPGTDNVAREAGRILSSLTGAAALVQPPRADDQHVAQLRWMRLRPGQLLAIVVTRSGAVQNRVVHVEKEPSPEELEVLHNYVESLLGERSLRDLREYVAQAAMTERSAYLYQAREVVDATINAAEERDVVIEGQMRLLGQPDFADVEKMRGVLGALHQKERLLELLDRTMAAGGVQVLIGAELPLVESQDLTLITAPYGSPGVGSGALGLLAPTRIDYQKVVPLVSCAAGLVSELLDKRH